MIRGTPSRFGLGSCTRCNPQSRSPHTAFTPLVLTGYSSWSRRRLRFVSSPVDGVCHVIGSGMINMQRRWTCQSWSINTGGEAYGGRRAGSVAPSGKLTTAPRILGLRRPLGCTSLSTSCSALEIPACRYHPEEGPHGTHRASMCRLGRTLWPVMPRKGKRIYFVCTYSTPSKKKGKKEKE